MTPRGIRLPAVACREFRKLHPGASGGIAHGTEYTFDDWNDEGPISASSHAHSNVAAMWQAILWADKSLKQSGDFMSINDIDCRFGTETTYTTKR